MLVAAQDRLPQQIGILRERLAQVETLVDGQDRDPDVRLHVVGEEVERRLLRQLTAVQHLVEHHRHQADLAAGIGLQARPAPAGDAVFADLAFDQPERGQIARQAVLGDLHFVGAQIADRIALLVAHDDVEQDDGALGLEGGLLLRRRAALLREQRNRRQQAPTATASRDRTSVAHEATISIIAPYSCGAGAGWPGCLACASAFSLATISRCRSPSSFRFRR